MVVVGANVLPQLSLSGWLHLEHRNCLPLLGGAYTGRGNLPERARSLPAKTPCAETRGGLEFQLGPPDEDVRNGAQNACQMSLQSGGDMRGL